MNCLSAIELSPLQQKIATEPSEGILYLEGPAGCGKTTTAIARLNHLLEIGVRGDEILILVPQRTLAKCYQQFLYSFKDARGGFPDILTVGGLAQRMVALFWPLLAPQAGFGMPKASPTFLTIETAQYFMERVASPFLDKGFFGSIKVDRNRLFSQILDNLNKAVIAGYPISETAERLKNAWVGQPEQLHVYDEAQECANAFRSYCLEHNLLDFSLQLELFLHYLWPSLLCRSYLARRYQHLIYDNVEEDVPASHDIIREWLPQFRSSLLIADSGAGYRTFLGADPESGMMLSELASNRYSMLESFVAPPEIQSFSNAMSGIITKSFEKPDESSLQRISFQFHRFYPQMIDYVADQVYGLVHDQEVPLNEIAIIAPYLSDSLRFSFMERFQQVGIAARSHRPSRSLSDEPATSCLLTIARLAHTGWDEPPSHFDVRSALVQAIEGMDLVRADILSRITYKASKFPVGLGPFEKIKPDMQARITYQLGEKYEILRQWIAGYQQRQPDELDVFISRLFGELLSQPGFGFHNNFDAASVTARLVESVQKFRWITSEPLLGEHLSAGKEFLRMLTSGVVAAQFVPSWYEEDRPAVLVAPAYTFLMFNQPVRYQFWLDVGGRGWWERLYQPLTHPYVLSRRWPGNLPWTDAHEQQANIQTLVRLVNGLTQRCKDHITLCAVGVNEQGEEIHGPLLMAFQNLIRKAPSRPEVSFV